MHCILLSRKTTNLLFRSSNSASQILQRDEVDKLSTGDPRELHFYFNGLRVGDISNNGTSDVDHVASITQHTSPGTGPFRNGAAAGTNYADFDQSYDPINGLNYESAFTRYSVQAGWAGVATAGLGAGIGQSLRLPGTWGHAASGIAGGLAAAAGESLITGTPSATR